MLKPRVLVVDDDEGVRYTLREILESSGLEVDVACDRVEALERLQLQPAQLVVTDLRMPRMDGMELLRKLMAQNPGAARGGDHGPWFGTSGSRCHQGWRARLLPQTIRGRRVGRGDQAGHRDGRLALENERAAGRAGAFAHPGFRRPRQ